METLTGTVVTLKLNSNDSIKTIKKQIKISPDEYLLMFKGKKLEDNHTLSECGIQNGSQLKLVPVYINLFVRTLKGERIPLEVKPRDTIKNVLEKIGHRETASPAGIYILYDGKILDGESTIADNKICSNSTLVLGLHGFWGSCRLM